jgi:DNA polymerase III epsilon subunit family exonuclease
MASGGPPIVSYRDYGFIGFDRAVVVDVETTGLDPKNDRVVSIACLRGSITEFATKGTTYLDRFEALLNPGIPIPPEATCVHGIKDSDVLGKNAFADIAGELRDFIGDLPLVGHNVSYDKAFLSEEFKRTGTSSLHRNKTFCTMRRLREHFGYADDTWSNMSLDEACARFGLKGRAAAAHSAIEDALLALQLAGGLYQLDNGLVLLGEPAQKPIREPSEAGARKGRRLLVLVAIALILVLLLLLSVVMR